MLQTGEEQNGLFRWWIFDIGLTQGVLFDSIFIIAFG